jgi:hypothetical protein
MKSMNSLPAYDGRFAHIAEAPSEPTSINTQARDLYYAYASVTAGKNFQGNPMPEWQDLPAKIREAWIMATVTAHLQKLGG